MERMYFKNLGVNDVIPFCQEYMKMVKGVICVYAGLPVTRLLGFKRFTVAP